MAGWKPVGTGGSSGGGGGGTRGWKPVGAGGGGSSGGGGGRILTKRQAQDSRGAKHETPSIFDQIGDAIKSVPSGLVHLGLDIGKEAVTSPVRLYQGIEQGDVDKALSAVPLFGQSYGITRGFVEGEQNSDSPFTSALGSSFRRTAEDVKDPERFIDAYNRGEIVGKLLEDVGNVALVGGAATKLLGVGARGTLAAAADAEATASAAGRAASTAAKVADSAGAQAAEHAAAVEQLGQVLSDAKFRAARAQAQVAYDKAAGIARDSAAHAAEMRTAAETATQTADAARLAADAARKAAGPRYAAYRIARNIARLGNEGAMLPAKPYQMVARGLSKATREVFEASPRLQEAVGALDTKLGIGEGLARMRDKAEMSGWVQRIESMRGQEAGSINRAYDRIEKIIGGDQDLYQAALIRDVARVTREQVIGLEDRFGAEAIDKAMREYADHQGISQRAVELGFQLARDEADALAAAKAGTTAPAPRVDPATAAKINQAGEIYDRIVTPLQERMLRETSGPGRRRNPSAEQRAKAQANLTGEGLMPGVEEAVSGPGGLVEQRRATAEANIERERATAAKQAERLGISELNASGATPDQIRSALAGRIADTQGQLKLRPAALTAVRQAAEAEGRAAVARSAAERIQALREAIPPSVPDEVVGKLADAVGRLYDAQQRLRAAPLELAQEAAGPSQRALIDDVRNVRAQALEVARAELDALPQVQGETALPFIPDDISEFHQQLHSELGAGDSNIRSMMERLRSKRTPNNEELFVRAYKRLWRDLPGFTKRAMRELNDREIRTLYRRWADGTVTMYEGGLDDLALEHAELSGLGELADHQANVQRYLSDYAYEHRLGEFVRRGGAGGWSENALRNMAASSRGPLGDFIRDPEVATALAQGPLDHVAYALGEARRAREAAAPQGAPIPDAQTLAQIEQDVPFPYEPSTGLEILAEAFGEGPDGPRMADFTQRWIDAGEPDLNGVINDLINNQPPAWLTGDQAAAAPTLDPAGYERLKAGQYGDGVTFDTHPVIPGDGVPKQSLMIDLWRTEGAARGTGIGVGRQILDDADASGTTLYTHVASDAQKGETIAAHDRLVAFYKRAGFHEVPASELFGDNAQTGTFAEGTMLRRDPVPPRAEPAGPQTPIIGGIPDEQIPAARKELESIVGEAGGQALRPDLAREAKLLLGIADRGEAKAATGAEAADKLISDVARPAAKKGVKEGQRVADYMRTLRRIGIEQKKIDTLGEWEGKQLERLYRDVENFPAPYRYTVRMARDFTREIANWKDELAAQTETGALDPETAAAFDEVIKLGINDVRDFFHNVAGPGGEIVREPRFERPRFVPGGRPFDEPGRGPAVAVTDTSGKMRKRRAQEEYRNRGGPIHRSTAEARELFARRIETRARNDAARLVQQLYGRRAEAVLGDIADMTPRQVSDLMAEQGYVAWDPEQLIGKRNLDDRAPSPEAEIQGTTFLPKPIYEAVQNYYAPAGGFERFMRRYYDRPLTYWRAAVLALRPAWHVNNIMGNALMAMTGAGIDPITYVKRIRQAKALLELPDAQLDVTVPNSVARRGLFAERRAARATDPARLARIEKRIGTIEEGTRRALIGDQGVEIPSQVAQREEGASLAQPGDVATLGTEADTSPNMLRRLVNRSYRLNGAVDDINRLAVFLESRAKLTPADVLNLQAKNPELTGLGVEQLRTEGAVRMSLRVAGDFLRMTPLERQVFRRIIPFYAWVRHITGLATKLALTNPARVVWMLHLAEMYGDPSDFGLQNTIPLGGGMLLQLNALNPYSDTIEVTNPSDFGFNLTPVAKVGAGALFGLDLNRFSQYQRPPGEPGGYGGSLSATPLIGPEGVRFGELANLLGSQFPQVRAARGFTDQLTAGEPIMRYPLGQPRTLNDRDVASGEPIFGPLARYLGAPYPREANIYEKSDLKVRQLTPRRSRSRR